MSPVQERVARIRRRFAMAVLARSVLVAAATAGLIIVAGLTLDALIGLPLVVRGWVAPVAAFVAVAILALGGVPRLREVLASRDEAVALWFEQRLPSLRYALVSSVDSHVVIEPGALAASIASAPLEAELATAARAVLLRPALALVAALLVLFVVPSGAVARVGAPRAGDSLARAGASLRAGADPLATIVARITSPTYAGLAVRAVDEPSSISALVGSRLRIEGNGSGVRAIVGGDTLVATELGNGWSVELAFPQRTTGVRLVGTRRSRVLVLEPVMDSVPSVRLDRPTRDSVLRVAHGAVPLSADLRDDLGLANAAFEYIVSSGAGETFTFRSGHVAPRRFDAGVRAGRIEGALLLDTLRLGPGDLIHLRAVAWDRNDVTGPGVGASETRTLRIARADEYDSVSVDPLPPTEPEKHSLSQRMILMMTQELEARRRRLPQPELTRESRRIALEQTRLRKRVGEVVFIRLGEDTGGEHSHFAGDGHEHGEEGPLDPEQILAAAERAANADPTRMLEGEGDESPIVAINRPLLEAYNHMWRASTELETARPAAAIPWMERAIEALQRARAAERIYLRGRPPRVVVDLARVRGTGKDRAVPSARAARLPVDVDRAALLARFDAILPRLTTDPLAAADSLLLIRLTLPDEDREAARALDAAAAAVRRGGEVTAALQRARRSLAGAPVRQDGLRPWGQ